MNNLLSNLIDSTVITTSLKRDTRKFDSNFFDKGLFGDGGGGGGDGGDAVGGCDADDGAEGATGGGNEGQDWGDGGGDGAPAIGADSVSSGPGELPQFFYVTSQSGVYTGSLSAQGNMLAMQINPGDYFYADSNNNQVNPATYTGAIHIKPWFVGYFREYWRDPTKCTFGANSAIPALTGVMPASFSGMQGNFNFYVDRQIHRLTGSAAFNNFYMINVIDQASAYINNTNNYLLGIKNAQNKNLNYYGFSNYNQLVTQNWEDYISSIALKKCFQNLGVLVESISTGNFGTPNAVAKTLINHGLGAIGNLSNQLYSNGITFDSIDNQTYSEIIKTILLSINNRAELDTIQAVLETSVPKLTSAWDYTVIETVSNSNNDSKFKNLSEVGIDLYRKCPNSVFKNGIEIYNLLTKLQNESSAEVENIYGGTQLLINDILNNLNKFLPITQNSDTINILNIIGTASGYLTEYMNKVNTGFEKLLATELGKSVRTLLSDLSRYAAGIPIDATEAAYSKTPNYWANRFYDAADQYFNLLNTIVTDPTTNVIAKEINDNYYQACSLLQIESANYVRANISVNSIQENSQIFGFVSSIPELAIDRNNIKTVDLLNGMAQTNQPGEILKTLIIQSRNNYFLSNAGAKITGTV